MALPNEHRCPMTACFAITELLEAILLNLDSRTLLLAQRVSHKFHAIIQRNDAFQQRLFLLPASPQEIAAIDFRPNQSARPDILIERGGEEDEEAERLMSSFALGKLHQSRCTQRAVLNPFLFELPPNGGRGVKEWPAQLCFGANGLALDERGYLPRDSLLRDMYLAHPMPSLLRFQMINWDSDCVDRYKLRGWDPKSRMPRTLGEVLEEVEHVAKLDAEMGWKGARLWVYGRRTSAPGGPGDVKMAMRAAKKARRKERVEGREREQVEQLKWEEKRKEEITKRA